MPNHHVHTTILITGEAEMNRTDGRKANFSYAKYGYVYNLVVHGRNIPVSCELGRASLRYF